MKREEYLKQLILEDSGTVKEFAKKVDMPYSTLHSILKNVDGAAIKNIFKICKGLGITTGDIEYVGLLDEKGYTPALVKNIEEGENAKDIANEILTKPILKEVLSEISDINQSEAEQVINFAKYLKSQRSDKK